MLNEFVVRLFGESSEFVKYLITILLSALPVFELRGGIPIGSIGFNIPWYICYILAVIGNLLPIPFILLFISKFIEWSKKTKHLSWLGKWLEKKANKNTAKIQKWEFIGLILFIAIPLPITGAWTGALVAGFTGMNKKKSFLAISIGVLIAGIIVTLICTGVLKGLEFLL